MWLEYYITDPNKFSEVRTLTPAEMREFLSLCYDLSADFSYENCLAFWQNDRNIFDQPTYFPRMLGGRCAQVFQAYLEFAEIPLSKRDQEWLAVARLKFFFEGRFEYENLILAKHEKLLVERGKGLSIEDFPKCFENLYLREALRIQTVIQILNALHNYNWRLEEYCRAMVTAHDVVCTLPRYQHLSLNRFDASGESAHRTAPNRLNRGYSAVDYAFTELENEHRLSMKESLAHDKWDPFCQRTLHNFLTKLYRDNHSSPDLHPLMIPRLDSDMAFLIQENRKLYQNLRFFDRRKYRPLKPHLVDYKFFNQLLTGLGIWKKTRFYDSHPELLPRALELFDLVERIVVYEFVTPDGSTMREKLFELPGFGGSNDQHIRVVGPSLRTTYDDATLKRLWQDGLRVEITNARPDIYHPVREPHDEHPWYIGKVTLHPASESAPDSPWYAERIQRHSYGNAYEKYKNVADPWRPGLRFIAEHYAEAKSS